MSPCACTADGVSVQTCATVRPLGEERDATSVSCRIGNESEISVV